MTSAHERRPSAVIKRSLVVAGHSTSISLEDAFWSALKAVAQERGRSIAAVVGEIDQDRHGANLSSAIRVYLLRDAQKSAVSARPEG